MESLPLDLLVRVLSLAASGPDSDGTLLLQVAPLVCRRWRDAARDPRCWAAVDVVMQAAYWPDPVQRRTREYLMLARARGIRNLEFSGQDGRPGYAMRKPYRSFALKPLRASRALVRNVSMYISGWREMCDDSKSAFVGLLWRSRQSIRSAELVIDDEVVRAVPPKYRSNPWGLRPAPFSPCERCQSPALRLCLLEVLAELPRLEALELEVDMQGYPILYDGELVAMATSRLRRLKVTLFDIPDGPSPEAVIQMLDDLLRAGAATLEDVEVSGWLPLPEPTLQLLAACPKLTRLAVAPACLEADETLLALESVKELVIDVCVNPDDKQFEEEEDDDDDDDDDKDDVDKGGNPRVDREARQLVQRAVANCQRRALQSLGALTVEVDFLYDRELIENEEAVCRESLTALSALRPSLKVTFVVNHKTKLSLNAGTGEAGEVANAQEIDHD